MKALKFADPINQSFRKAPDAFNRLEMDSDSLSNTRSSLLQEIDSIVAHLLETTSSTTSESGHLNKRKHSSTFPEGNSDDRAVDSEGVGEKDDDELFLNCNCIVKREQSDVLDY